MALVKITTIEKKEKEIEIQFPWFVRDSLTAVRIDSEIRYTVAWVSPGKTCANLATWDQNAGEYFTAEIISEDEFLKYVDEALTIIQKTFVHQL